VNEFGAAKVMFLGGDGGRARPARPSSLPEGLSSSQDAARQSPHLHRGTRRRTVTVFKYVRL